MAAPTPLNTHTQRPAASGAANPPQTTQLHAADARASARARLTSTNAADSLSLKRSTSPLRMDAVRTAAMALSATRASSGDVASLKMRNRGPTAARRRTAEMAEAKAGARWGARGKRGAARAVVVVGGGVGGGAKGLLSSWEALVARRQRSGMRTCRHCMHTPTHAHNTHTHYTHARSTSELKAHSLPPSLPADLLARDHLSLRPPTNLPRAPCLSSPPSHRAHTRALPAPSCAFSLSPLRFSRVAATARFACCMQLEKRGCVMLCMAHTPFPSHLIPSHPHAHVVPINVQAPLATLWGGMAAAGPVPYPPSQHSCATHGGP